MDAGRQRGWHERKVTVRLPEAHVGARDALEPTYGGVTEVLYLHF